MNVRRSMVVGGALLTLVGLMSTPRLLFGADQPKAKELIQQNCVQCHRMEGQAESRFNLKAPDLVRDASPACNPPLDPQLPLVLAVGGEETAGYIWQAESFCRKCCGRG